MPVSPPSNAEQVFHGVLHDVWQWDQERFDGSHATYECVVRQDAVGVIGFLDPRTIVLTRQEQPGKDRPFLDVPGGRVEKGETHEQAARREFLEETGLTIGRIVPFRTVEHYGSSRFVQVVYIATELTDHVKEKYTEPGEKIELMHTRWDEAVRLSAERKMRQPEVMLAIMALEYHQPSKDLLKKFLEN